jgi:hypothetical protein
MAKQATSPDEGINSDPVETDEELEEALTSTPEGLAGDKTISQDDFNKLAGKIRQEARDAATKKAYAEVLGKAGVKTVEELVAAVEAQKTSAQEKMTELERLNSELEDARSLASSLEQGNKELTVRAKEALLKSSVVALAAGRFQDAEVAFRLLNRSGVTVSDDGTVEGVEAALASLAEQYPFLKRRAVSSTNPANPNEPKGAEGRTDQERRNEYFGQQGNEFWKGRGVQRIIKEENS